MQREKRKGRGNLHKISEEKIRSNSNILFLSYEKESTEFECCVQEKNILFVNGSLIWDLGVNCRILMGKTTVFHRK